MSRLLYFPRVTLPRVNTEMHSFVNGTLMTGRGCPILLCYLSFDESHSNDFLARFMLFSRLIYCLCFYIVEFIVFIFTL